jgi:hypothetical protein
MNTSTTNSKPALSRRANFSRTIRRFLGTLLLAGLTAVLFLVVFINGCQNENQGIVNVCLAPTVIRTSPADGVTNVAFNGANAAKASAHSAAVKKGAASFKKKGVTPSASASAVKLITATFSTPMNTNSITTNTFTVQQGSTFLQGTVTYSDTTAIFIAPNGLGPNLIYTCTITTGAKDLAGTALASSYVWRFNTIAAATPTLVAPLNGAVSQAVNPTLIWNAVAGAGTYRLQVSTSNSFASTVYDDSARTNTSQAITGLTIGTTYYWRVNSKISGGTSAYSDVWSFTTIATPAAPVLIAPLDAAVNISTSPALSWNASTGAATYRLQVSLDNSFASTIYDDSTRTNTSQTITGLTAGTVYYWRVNAKNIAGTSAYASRSFTTIVPGTPTLISPVNGAISQATNPTLIWNAVPGADTYRLQVSTSNSFASTVYDDSTRTIASQAITGLTVGTTYYWRVNSKTSGRTSAYSDIWSFTTIAVPAAPVLVTPANAAVNILTSPTLSWNVSAGAATYRLQVSTSSSFATTVYDDSTRTSTSQAITGLTIASTYYWRVNAKNAAGTSSYSAAWSFTTITAPAAPVLVTPDNAAVNVSTSPTLSWNVSAGSATYRLQVSTVNNFATTVYNDSTRTNTSQAITGLTVGTIYYWRVNAKNAAGTSAYSTVWSFTTIAQPAVPVLLAPDSAAVNISTSPTLSWNTSTGAVTYRLQVSTVNNFTTTVYNDSTRTNTSQALTGLTVGTIYYWRVNAKNAAGTSGYSNVWRFTTSAALAAPILLAPDSAAANISTSPTLSWNASTGAVTYRLQVSTVSNFTTTVYNDSTRTNTLQAITGLNSGSTYYWRVNAKNAAGTSVYSNVWSFSTIAPPVAPVLVAPVNAAVNVSPSPELSWLASTGAVTYRLQVSTGSGFATTVYDDSTLTSLLKTMTGLTSGNTYYWRVNAKNNSGTSNYSTIWHFTTGAGALGSASTFGLMATSAITSTGNSIINGDVSLNPGTSITGFTFSTSPGPGVVNGAVHINDGVSAQAKADLLAAYNFAKGLSGGTPIPDGQDLGAWQPTGSPFPPGTLAPGVYSNGSTMSVNTPLVLDAQGDANAVWVFQIGSSLTTVAGSPGGNVTLAHGAQAKNVFWVPTDDATIGSGTVFNGTIVSGRDVTAVTGATINGRILCGAITAGTLALQTGTVNVPAP